MPIEAIKYRCEFKCGTKAKSTLKQINQHELTCWNNPARRCCTTCKHEIYEKDGCDHPELPGAPSESWMNRGCKKLNEEAFEAQMKRSDYHNKPVFHIPPVHSCPFWEQKI